MIVITTPTGQIGRQVLDEMLDSDEQVRVIERDPSRLDPQTSKRVEVVQGSHEDSDVVNEAFADADCVFWLVPQTPTPRASRATTWTSPVRRAKRSRTGASSA